MSVVSRGLADYERNKGEWARSAELCAVWNRGQVSLDEKTAYL